MSEAALAIRLGINYLSGMAKNVGMMGPKAESAHSEINGRSSSSGRFLSVASLEPVTKRATLTSARADKVVQEYLNAQAK
ncbi:hypothetical protein [Sphingomonas sp. 28-63-12]|uniref:hypothetical protein n=1 Tax=Sphingomonas sp. 28-63-12 TaxID=1970434 RepID=UPI000BDDE2DC|nr:MAG: hypothetical protein B7Y47_08350 [Sphingomonas sp. 28-63-12]